MRRKAASGKRPVMIVRVIKSPIRAISKALDLYTKWITNFAINYNRPLMIMEAVPNSHHLRSRSFTILSDSDHLPGPLIRAITTTNRSTSATQDMSNSTVATRNEMWHAPRTGGVGMRTIHEDRTCSFRDDGIVSNKMKLADKICFVVNSVCH